MLHFFIDNFFVNSFVIQRDFLQTIDFQTNSFLYCHHKFSRFSQELMRHLHLSLVRAFVKSPISRSTSVGLKYLSSTASTSFPIYIRYSGLEQGFVNPFSATPSPLNSNSIPTFAKLMHKKYRRCFFGSNHPIFRFFIPQNHPHYTNIILKVTPIPFSIQVS